MTSLSIAAIGLAIGSFLLAGSCLFLVHCKCPVIAKIGRRLFIAALLAKGVVGLLGAVACHEGLAPLGLLAGLFIVAMLWEAPVREIEHQTTS